MLIGVLVSALVLEAVAGAAIVVGVVRFAGLYARVDITLQRIDTRLADFEEHRGNVRLVPGHAKRIAQLEDVVETIVHRSSRP